MRKLTGTLVLLVAMSSAAAAQDAKTLLDNTAKAMGAQNATSIQIVGSGSQFILGQSLNPSARWPRFNAKTYTLTVDYAAPAAREEMVRTQALNPPQGGGLQAIVGEQKQVQLVSGTFAWNLNPADNNPVPQPTAVTERLMQIMLTPHGFLKAAMANNDATVKEMTFGAQKYSIVTFKGPNKANIKGSISDQNIVTSVETLLDHPLLGDMHVSNSFYDYKDFNGVKFPSHIVQVRGSHPVLDINITDVKTNVAAAIAVPDAVRQAIAPPPARVESQKIADGVHYLTGATHHSVAVEFSDFVTVIEGPQNEERSNVVIAEVKRLFPNKPIRYLVNTHHHFDHSGGIRTFAAEGATIVTHQQNKSYYEILLKARRELNPDRLDATGLTALNPVEGVATDRVITDGTRNMQLHHVLGNSHSDSMLLVYLPSEKILVEADAFTPPAAGTAPAPVNISTVNLHENVERLKLDVNQILPLHGRAVPMSDLLKAVGKS